MATTRTLGGVMKNNNRCSRLQLSALAIAGLFYSFAAQAITISLSPSIDQSLRDFDRDGYFEDPLPESGNPLSETLRLFSGPNLPGYVESRSALEFSLASIPNGANIESAIFTFTVEGRTGEDPFEFHGYLGNGTIESADMNVVNLIGGPFRAYSAGSSYSFDLTSLTALAMQSGFVGISSRMTACDFGTCGIEIASSEFQTRLQDRPVLTVQFTLTAVPLPAAFWLFGSGVIGLFGFVRSHKTT